MINEQLLNYIRQALTSGTPKENIKSSLIASGWGEQDIETGFLMINQQSSNNIQTSEQQPFTPQTINNYESMDRPNSVKYFEVLMYSSIVLSIFASVFQYSKYIASVKSFYFLLTPLISIMLSIVFTYFAARKKANWARQVLLVLFIVGLPGLFGAFSLFFVTGVNSRIIISSALTLIQMALQVGALYCIFSGPSNEWFSPRLDKSASNPNGSNITNSLSAVWTKTIPRTNTVFMVISLILVFGVDLSILISSPELAMFWYIMLAVLAVFALFFILENFIFKARFANTTSNLDPTIATLIGLRNFLFLLNFIPFIQLLGLAGLGFIGWAIVLVYVGLLIARSNQTKKIKSGLN
jgi:hypothetical protein